MFENDPVIVDGHILLCRQERDLEAWLIQKVLRSRYNHTATLVEINGQAFVFEARGGHRVRPVPLSQWRDLYKYQEIKTIPAKINFNKLMESKDVRYDIWSCVNHALMRITGAWHGAKSGRGALKFYCMEHTAYVCDMDYWWMATPNFIESYKFSVK